MSIEGKPAKTGSEANGTIAERQFDSLLRLANSISIFASTHDIEAVFYYDCNGNALNACA